MSYAQMEAMLVQRIAEARQSEAWVLRALDDAKTGAPAVEMGERYVRLQQQLDDIEQLLAKMDIAAAAGERPAPQFVPGFAPQFSAAL